MNEQNAIELLPQKKVAITTNPERLKYFHIAEPKWGKTTFYSGIERVLYLCFEEGHAFIEAFKIVIDCWDRPLKEKIGKEGWWVDKEGITHTSAIQVIDALEASCPYDFIVVDTADMMAKLGTDYMCKENNVDYPSDIEWKGWDLLQNSPFRRFMVRLVKLGVGVAFISHLKVIEKKDKAGNVVSVKRESTLPNGIQQLILKQCDLIINGTFGRRRKGMDERDRFITFDGSSEVLAGSRIKHIYVPKNYIVAPPTKESPNAPWDQWKSFFEQSPDAGRAAEAEYNKLVLGKDDENVPVDKPVLAESEPSETVVESTSKPPTKFRRTI